MYMKTPAYLYCAFLSLAFFTACNSDSAAPKKQDAALPSSPLSKDSIGVKPEIWLYAVTVNDLLLRGQPTKNSVSVGRMQEGAFCIGRGTVSKNREEATLRDIQYNEPYFQVNTLGAAPKEGWAYGGGLLCIYAGTEKEAPDMEKLSALSNFFKNLDLKKIASGKQAWDYVKNRFSDTNKQTTDAAFFLLLHFLSRMEYEGDYYTQTEQFPWTEQDQEAIHNNTFDVDKYPLTRQFANSGFRPAYAEGAIFPVVDYQALADFFSPRCSPGAVDYLKQSLEEQLNPEFSDGGIVLPLQQVADRAAFWEKFNLNYPYFPLSEETRSFEQFTREILMTGSDNTPIFNYETKEILPEYKETWDYVLSKYPQTATGAQIKSFRDLCAREGWKYTKAVEQKEMEILGLPAE
jgi:hypothetical protein